MVRFVTRSLVKRSTLVLAGMLVLTAVAAVLALRVRFDFSPQTIFAGHEEMLAHAEDFKEVFGYDDATLLVLLEATGERDVLEAEALTWQGRVAEDLSEVESVELVESITTLRVPFARLPFTTGGSGIDTKPLVPKLPVDEFRAGSVRERLADSEMIEETLLDADRQVAAIAVLCDPQAQDIDLMRRIVADVESVLGRHPAPEGYAVSTSGLPSVRVDIVENLQSDQQTLFPIAGGLFVVVLTLLWRRTVGTLVPLLAAGAGLAWTMATMALLGQTFGLLSNVLPILLLVVGMSNAVHVVSRYAEESVKYPRDRRRAAQATLQEMAIPCLLTFSTTAIGFLSLALTHSMLLRSFAWQAAMGMAFLYASVMGFSAALLWRMRAPRFVDDNERQSRTGRMLLRLNGYLQARPKTLLGGSLVVIAAALWVSRNVEVNSSILETFEESHPTMRTLDVVDERLGGLLPLQIDLETERPEAFLDPEVFNRVAAAQAFVAEQPGVTFARSYVDLYQEVGAGRRSEERDALPADDEKGRQQLQKTDERVTQMAEAIHPQAFLAADGSRARILVRTPDLGTKRSLELVRTIEGRLAELFPEGGDVRARLTGTVYLNAMAMDQFVRDVFVSLATASAVIFAVITLLFRSLRVGLIAAIPNAFPLIVTLGYMGLRGYPLNAGNVIVFCIGIGIAVDNTIHFVSRFREELGAGRDVSESITHTLRGTGRAIVLTSFLLVSGLSVLLLSDFVPTRRFGELISVTMGAALIGDLVLLPVSLLLFWKSDGSRRPRAAELRDDDATPPSRVPALTN